MWLLAAQPGPHGEHSRPETQHAVKNQAQMDTRLGFNPDQSTTLWPTVKRRDCYSQPQSLGVVCNTAVADIPGRASQARAGPQHT